MKEDAFCMDCKLAMIKILADLNTVRVTWVLHVSAGPQQTSWQVMWLCFPIRIPQKHVLCNGILCCSLSESVICCCEEKT